MDDDRLERLLELLNRGDQEAAEEVFLAYTPYLRMVVRRRLSAALRVKFDSMDIVQSVWADLVRGLRKAEWRFADAAHLRGFLATATQNRFIDRARQQRLALLREEPLPDEGTDAPAEAPGPLPIDVAQANELWERILSASPPAHHEILRLKRQGVRLAEIASRTGLHEGSVRRILYNLAHRFGVKPESSPAIPAVSLRH